MDYSNLVNSSIQGWKAAREETLEILDSLDDDRLQFKPKGGKWQPLYWEFGCIGRTQIVYTKAIESGKVDFSLFSSPVMPSKTKYQTKNDLINFLEKSDIDWLKAIKLKKDIEDYGIDWGNIKMPLIRHIACLSEHERLHHGQFISYFTIAHFELPEGFMTNWALSSRMGGNKKRL